MSSLVPCVCWVPKGASKEVPDKVALSQEEIQELIKQAQDQMRDLKLSESKKGGAAPRGKGERKDDGEEMVGAADSLTVEEEYGMTHYSSSESEGEGEKISGAGMGNSLAGLAYYASNDSDPYITLKKTAPEDEEEEDVNILPTDNVLVVGRAEEEFSSLEVYVFSEADVHTYSHHELLLTSFPLALEWLDFDPEQPDKKGSYVAVGMMSPCIEVWDLDMMDSLEPIYVLGDLDFHLISKSFKKTKKKTKQNKSLATESGGASGGSGGGHSDAVLTLSWNRVVRSVLASGSADRTVRVWDLTGPKCVVSLPHPDKVQCIQWHPYEPQLLVTGAFDGKVRLYDCRAPESAVRVWSVDGEVEKVLWNHLIPEQLLVSTDAKSVYCMDKATGSSLFQIHAHEDAITDLSLSCYVPGLLVTASSDDTIKFWDTQDNKPVFLHSRKMHMKAVLCARFCVDAPYALVVGGSTNGFQVMDVSQLQEVSRKFHGRDLVIPVLPGREEASRGKRKAGRATHTPRGMQIKGKEKEAEEEEEEEEVEGGMEREVEELMQLERMEVEAGAEASSQASFSLPKPRREGVRSKKRKDKKITKEKRRH